MANKNGSKGSGFVNCISFYALAGVGVVLILNTFGLFSGLSNLIETIAHAITYCIIAINAYYFVKGKSTAFVVVYAVSLVLIVLVLIWPILSSLFKG